MLGAATRRVDYEDAKAMALFSTPIMVIFKLDPVSTNCRQTIHDVVKRDNMTLEEVASKIQSLASRYKEDEDEVAEEAELMAKIAKTYCDTSRSIEVVEPSLETAYELLARLDTNRTALEDIIGALDGLSEDQLTMEVARFGLSEDQLTMAVARFRDTAMRFDNNSKERYPILCEAEDLFNHSLQRVLDAQHVVKQIAESHLLGDEELRRSISNESVGVSDMKGTYYDKFFIGVKLTLEMIIERAAKSAAPSAADNVAEPASDDVVDPASDDVVDPASDDVVEPASDDVVEPASDDVVDPASNDAVEPAVKDSALASHDVAERATGDTPEPESGEVADQASNDVAVKDD